MDDSLKEIVYSKNIVEFVTVANEYCTFVENIAELDKENMINRSVKLLSLLYLKATMLPETERINDEQNEKFVTEFDWQFVKNGVEALLADDDKYLDFYDNEMNETAEPVSSGISENMADIYQDMKDFLLLYQTGTGEVMNDAVWECRMNFESFWGQKLVNSMRAVHKFIYSGEEIGKVEKKNEENDENRNTADWFITRRQKDFRGDIE
jgi:hypothetical protein